MLLIFTIIGYLIIMMVIHLKYQLDTTFNEFQKQILD